MTMILKSAALATAAALMSGAVLAQEASFSTTDANADGVVTLPELQAAIPEATGEQFAAADADGDGALTAEEFATLNAG